MVNFKAHLDNLPLMIDYIRKEAETIGLNAHEIYKIELAAEEALVNIISYAYENSKDKRVEIYCEAKNHHFEIIISDDGKPFNPIDSEIQLNKDLPPEKRPIGGLGIYLIRKLMDEVTYQRKDNRNFLKMIVRFGIPEESK